LKKHYKYQTRQYRAKNYNKFFIIFHIL